MFFFMIVITGAAGFIGSCMVQKMNDLGRDDLALVDDFTRKDKTRNLAGKRFKVQIQRNKFIGWLEKYAPEVEAVLHLGARTDTTEQNKAVFDHLNYHYSQAVWMVCSGYGIPLIYASSAATYGAGEHGYADDEAKIGLLQPLNPYGWSKQEFDLWAISQSSAPPFWAGFKFFNVYGPNEYHKNRMASVIFHAVRQIISTGEMQLFKSHRPDFGDGEQSRDFIYVKDLVDVLAFFLEKKPQNGLFNLGTGKARSFRDLVENTFHAMQLEPKIRFIDTPVDIRNNYQYFTEADMSRVRATGYDRPFFSLEDGVRDYVQRYLLDEKIF
jgi:ADP-L-glycero-D-manno-heptose 6-epimerase